MRLFKEHLISLVMITALVSPVVISGCSGHAEYRVYDPYYGDYHVWDNNEVVYYQRWEHDTHRDDRDFRHRSKDEQKEYWTWRHNQDHDHH
jgi:hypothetical protein